MRWWAALVVGVVALATGATLLATARHLPPAFSSAASAGPSVTASGAPGSGVPRSSPPPTSASPAAPVPDAFEPASATLAAFGVTAPVQPVYTAEGVLAPPDDPARLGWWASGAWAGSSHGATVLVGHVDGPQGPGALYRLVHARVGDPITVASSNGQQQSYAVTSLGYHGKGSALPASLFTSTGAPRLVVISCGGPFDRSDDQYEDNVVVQASPV